MNAVTIYRKTQWEIRTHWLSRGTLMSAQYIFLATKWSPVFPAGPLCMLTLHKLLGCVRYGFWVPQYLSVFMTVHSNARTMSWYDGLGRGWRSNLLCHVGTCVPTTCSHIPDEYNLLNMCKIFYILLTVHPGMILVNNQLDAQFFMYVYFYSLHV